MSLLHDLGGVDSCIYRFDDGNWEVIRRIIRVVVPGLTPFDVSADGSRFVLGDFNRLDLVDGPTVITMPREWTYNEIRHGHVFQQRVYGRIWGGSISGDGQVVTMSGREIDRSQSDSLVWFGGSDLLNLNEDMPRDEVSYGAGIPSVDGSVIFFAGSTNRTSPSHNAQLIWRWEDGELTEIPSPQLFAEQRVVLRDISEDGQAVFGTVEGPARGGISHDPIDAATPWSRPLFGQHIAWMWTESGGSVPIIDHSRFLETEMVSVDADGSVALIRARPHGSRYSSQYLWFGDNKFIELEELFHSLNLSIDVAYYGFNEISNDGTKLMGLASQGGQTYSHAIIVTIPDFTP